MKENLLICTLISLITISLFIGSSLAYGVGVFSKSEAPFGTPSDVWINKWWSWWITTTNDEALPNLMDV